MPVTEQLSADGQTLTIKIQGRFDFSVHQEFRSAYESQKQKSQQYIIDLRDTVYLDSSALGMLLLLRDHAGGVTSRIKIVNPNHDIRKILTISNFGQLFAIE